MILIVKVWSIDSSTLGHRVTNEKLIEGIDYKKSGKVWLITKTVMERLFGFLRIKSYVFK